MLHKYFTLKDIERITPELAEKFRKNGCTDEEVFFLIDDKKLIAISKNQLENLLCQKVT